MRVLLPEHVADADIHACYARDWLDVGGIRMNFVMSLDGAVSAEGLSRGLQTPGDNRVFAALRDLADVVLVGSGTALAEQYSRPRPAGQRLLRRHGYGFADDLPIAILSRSGSGLHAGLKLFESPDEPRPIVFTTARADLAGITEVADVIVAGEDEINFARVRTELADRGLTRVICEGGPTIFAQAAAADAVDEVCLSVSPLLAGPGPGRIMAGTPWTIGVRALRLHTLLEEDGALFLRYARA